MKTPLLFPAAAAMLWLAACSKHPAPPAAGPERPPVEVRAQKVEAKPHVAFEEATGTVRAKVRATLEAKLPGRIEKMPVEAGQKIKRDEPLVLLDTREAEARLDQAKAVLEQAEKELARHTALAANKVTAQAELEAVQARHRVAKAALAGAETNLGYMTLRAPFDGVVTRKLADAGDLAAPGKPLLEIEDPSAFRFEADLPETVIGHVKLGAALPVRVGPLETEGTVGEIAPAADAQSRTFAVKLDLPPAPGLRSGQFGRVAVPVSETSVLRIPAPALVQRGQMEIVFVAEGGKARLRLVKSGKRFGDEIEVLSGIDAGESVITGDAAQQIDGQRVEVSAQ